MKLSGQSLSRKTLKPMFYGQCYVTVPFALLVDLALMLGSFHGQALWQWALAMFLAGLVWYLVALIRGFMVHRNVALVKAVVQTVLAVLFGTLGLIVALALSLLTGPVVPMP